ncbi:MAG: hypothetical protein ACIWVG_07885, partial [Gloeotrichia echinulata HAB0833]
HKTSRDAGNSVALARSWEATRAILIAVVFSILSVVRVFNISSHRLTANIACRTDKITTCPE